MSYLRDRRLWGKNRERGLIMHTSPQLFFTFARCVNWAKFWTWRAV